jgi:DNA adenine methylase
MQSYGSFYLVLVFNFILQFTDDTYHQNLSYSIQQLNHKYWIVTYDDVTRIRNLYDFTNGQKYDIRYSANAKRKETELLFCSPITQVESFDKVIFSNV